jgi:hypothetical protein
MGKREQMTPEERKAYQREATRKSREKKAASLSEEEFKKHIAKQFDEHQDSAAQKAKERDAREREDRECRELCIVSALEGLAPDEPIRIPKDDPEPKSFAKFIVNQIEDFIADAARWEPGSFAHLYWELNQTKAGILILHRAGLPLLPSFPVGEHPLKYEHIPLQGVKSVFRDPDLQARVDEYEKVWQQRKF